MNGALMMLKSLGFDPDKIISMVKDITDTAQSIDNRLNAQGEEIKELRAENARIIELLTKLTTNGE